MTDVVSLNLTDLGADGESDVLSDRILDVATACAKVVNSPRDLIAAQYSMAALRRAVEGELEYYPELIDAIGRLLATAESQVGGGARG